MTIFPLELLKSRLPKALLVFGVILVWVEVVILLSAFSSLPPRVPLFYSQPWGVGQLAATPVLFLFPLLGAVILGGDLLFSEVLWRRREVVLATSLLGLGVISGGLLLVSLARIVFLTAGALQVTLAVRIFLAASLAFCLSLGLTPVVERVARRLGIIDDPETHQHPAILHKKPVPRAGAVAFLGGFLITSLLFLPLVKRLIGLYLGALVATTLGVLDDSRDLNPYLRLGIQVLAALIIVAAGIGITFFRNPFGGVISLTTVDIPINIFGEHHILLLADLFALLWLVWMMNMSSWSNGVDGQFSGTVSITFLVLTILSLRFVSYEPLQGQTALLSAIAGGAALGLLPRTWHPAKIFWGFGATACGLIIATLSILSGAKVATASLVLLVPILDALVAIGRRVLRGQSPVWGDREHLHHHLLNRGLTQRQVASLYWLLAGICGILALYTAGKSKALTLLMAGGVVGFVLILVNLGGRGLRERLEGKKEQTGGGEDELG